VTVPPVNDDHIAAQERRTLTPWPALCFGPTSKLFTGHPEAWLYPRSDWRRAVELAIFLIQLSQATQLRYTQPTGFLLPVEEHCFADTHLSTDLYDARATSGLAQ